MVRPSGKRGRSLSETFSPANVKSASISVFRGKVLVRGK